MTERGDGVLSDAPRAGPVAPFAARVLDAAGDVVGGGFVVGPGQVATCAHVVSAVLGGSPEDPSPPPGRLRLDLPLLDPPQAGEAVVRTWRPIDPATGVGDVAILEIVELAGAPPDAVGMPPLYRPDRLWGHRFRVLGFPPGMQDGVWAAGELRERQGTRWLQLQTDPHGPPIAQGFSGAPVWDEDVQAVVGMTVASDLRPGSTTAYMVPIEDVLGADPRLMSNPYRGLEPFGEEHADVFYGREDEVDRLDALLDRQPLVAVVGRSGTGKSSLVRAGLLPRLRSRGVRIVELLPGPADEPTSETLDRLAAALARPADGGADRADPGTLLFADQFEELVGAGATPATGGPTRAQAVLRRLVDEVRSAPPRPDGTPSLRVVLTLRWEAMNELLTDDVVETFEQGTFSLAAMSRDQLRRAVVGPAARAPGLAFEPGLVERILDDAVAEPGQLPLVESLLAQLWDSRRGGTLTIDAFDQLGGVKGAIARHAEHAVGRLSSSGDGDHDLRRLFTALARPDEGAGFVRRPARLEGLSGDQRRVVESLARSRLLVVGQETDGDHTVELAHQALIDHWPRLRRWLDEDREFLVWQHETERQRLAWERTGHDQDALLRGVALTRATEWLERRGDGVTAPIRAFVEASRGRQRRAGRRRRALLSTAALAAALVLVLGTTLVDQRRDTRREAAMSASRSLATLASDTAAEDPALAMLYALAAHEHHPTPEAERALFRLYAEYRDVETVLTGAHGDITYADASPDGQVMAAMTSEDRVTVWSGRSGRPVTARQLERPPVGEAVMAIGVTPGGEGVMVVETSRAWYHDVATGERRWEFSVDGEVASVALRDDGAAVLSMTVGGESRLEVWAPSGDGARRVAELVPPPGLSVSAGGFGPRDEMVVVRTVDAGEDLDDVDSRLQVWNTRTGELTSLATDVGGQALSPDGTVAMACHTATEGSSSLELIDLRDRSSRTYEIPEDSDCSTPSAIATSNDVMVLDSGKLRLDLRTGETTIQPSPLDDQPPIHVMAAWQEDGRTLFLAHDVNRFVARELTTDDELIVGLPDDSEGTPDLATARGAVHLSPGGDHLVSVLEGGRQLVASRPGSRGLDFPTEATADRPAPHQEPSIADIAFDQERSLVADRVAPDRVQVRRLPSLELVSEVTTAEVPEEARAASFVAFTGDGLLASNGVHLEWWDPATGEELDALDLAAQGLVRTADATNVAVRQVPDSSHLALVDPERDDIRIVDGGSGRVVDTIQVGRDAVEVGFQPESPYFAVARRGGSIEMWHRDGPRRVVGPVTVPETQGDMLSATSDVLVRGGFLDEPGRFLLATGSTATQGPQLRWYDAGSTTPERALDLGPPGDSLGSGPQPIELSADGNVALFAITPFTTSLVPSSQVVTFDLRPEAWRDAICRWVAGRRFTEAEVAMLPDGTDSLSLC